MSSLSIVIVTWNRSSQLKRCLNSLINVHNDKLIDQVIVVDNNSTDNTSVIISEFQDENPSLRLLYLRNPENLGCPIARNIGLENVTSDYAYCLDDDGWLEENALVNILKLMLSNSEIAIAYSKILSPDDLSVLNGVECTRKTVLFNAGSTIYNMRILSKVGLFPEYRRQMEESHLAFRLFDAGYKIFSCNESIMFHEKQKTQSQKKEELYLNFLNEFFNYKDLFPAYFVIIIFLLRFIGISRQYSEVNCSFKDYIKDIFLVASQVIRKTRRYKLSPLVYIKFIYAYKK